MESNIDIRIDVSGQCCPLPLIGLAMAIRDLQPGQALEILGNDPIFESSVRDFCIANGHAVLAATSGKDHGVSIVIRVGG